MATESLGRIRAVLFDMDGLLIDSERIYTDVVNDILRPYGKEQSWDVKSKLMGQPERAATRMYRAFTPQWSFFRACGLLTLTVKRTGSADLALSALSRSMSFSKHATNVSCRPSRRCSPCRGPSA